MPDNGFEARIKLSQELTKLWTEEEPLKKIRAQMMQFGEELHEYYKKCLRGEKVVVKGEEIKYDNAADCLRRVAEKLGISREYFKLWRGGASA